MSYIIRDFVRMCECVCTVERRTMVPKAGRRVTSNCSIRRTTTNTNTTKLEPTRTSHTSTQTKHTPVVGMFVVTGTLDSILSFAQSMPGYENENKNALSIRFSLIHSPTNMEIA